MNLSFINEHLENLGVDFQIKPVGLSNKLFWLYETQDLYAIKVTSSFVQALEQELESEETHFIDLHSIFDDNFIAQCRGPFIVFPGIGFIAKDYAELYIGYQNWNIDIEGPEAITVGNTEIWVSSSSSLHQLLNERHNEYDAEMDRLTTICLKGTSRDALEDDLAHALYYLDLLMPVDETHYFDDLDKLRIWSLKEESTFTNPQVFTESLPLPKSVHSIPVKYFVEAERLIGEVSILYYYKVLEYFFGLAWRQRITTLISATGTDEVALAEALEAEQPKNELDSLRFVVTAIQNDKLWEIVQQSGYCLKDVDKLARKIYQTRNEIAHGKEDGRLSLIVPKIIPLFIQQEQINVFRLLAREALIFFGAVESGSPGVQEQYV